MTAVVAPLFAGFVSAAGTSRADARIPAGGRTVWAGRDRLFIAGNWPAEQCVTIDVGTVRAVILGICFADIETIRAAVAGCRTSDYAAVLRLDGNFNLIVRDRAGLHIHADLASLRPIYYTTWRGTVAYASRSVALRQLTGASVDRDHLAASLCLLGTVEAIHGSSLFTGVHAIPGGHRLVIDSGKPRIERYWSPTRGRLGLADGADLLRDALGRAVAGRIAGPGCVTSDMSGGFDSTTVALLAADRLAERGRDLIGVTFGNSGATEVDDVEIAGAAAASRTNIDHVVLPDDAYPLPYGRMDRAPASDEPLIFLCVLEKMRIVFDLIASTGSDVHLNGEGGDPVVLSARSYVADLFRQGRIATFARHVYGWSRVHHRAPWTVAAQAMTLALTPYRRWARAEAVRLTTDTAEPARMGWSGTPWTPGWLTPDVLRSAAGMLRDRADIHPLAPRPGVHRTLVDLAFTARIARGLGDVAEFHGVRVDYPYLDTQVITACLTVRPHERTSPYAFKPLIVRAFADVLPDRLVARTGKGDFTGGMFEGIRLHAAELHEQLQTSCLADLGLVDLPELHAAIDRFANGLSVGLPQFNYTLAAEYWLRNLDHLPDMWDEERQDDP